MRRERSFAHSWAEALARVTMQTWRTRHSTSLAHDRPPPRDLDEPPAESLERLVERLLLDRTDGLSPHALAAFIDGWGSLLKVLDRSDLVFPAPVGGSDAAAEEARQVLRAGVQRIREAQALILDDDPEDLDAPL